MFQYDLKSDFSTINKKKKKKNDNSHSIIKNLQSRLIIAIKSLGSDRWISSHIKYTKEFTQPPIH